MRRDRKKRRRSRVHALEAHLTLEQSLLADSEKKTNLYRNMSRSFWERWRWELQQRKDSMLREKALLRRSSVKVSTVLNVHEIDPESLFDPVDDAYRIVCRMWIIWFGTNANVSWLESCS